MRPVSLLAGRREAYAEWLVAGGLEVVDSADVLLADPALLAEADLSGVRWIQSTWAGVDSVDWSRVPEDTVLTNLPGVFGPQMAEYVFGHLLGRTQRIPQRHATRVWDTTVPDLLRGSTLGILGAGSIGGCIAEAGRLFGMSVVGCRRSGAPDPRYDSMFSVSEVDRFAEGLDHLVVVLPATAETAGLVGTELLERVTAGASLINVGRGSTVDTIAVVRAVRAGRVGLAVLDVTEPEPLPADHPAWREPNLVITGHTAAISDPRDTVSFFLDNLARFDSGAELLGVVQRSRGY